MLKVFRNKLIWLITFIHAIFPFKWLFNLEYRLRMQRWPERFTVTHAVHVTPELYEFTTKYYKPNHIEKVTGKRVTDCVHIRVPFVVTHRYLGAMIGKPGDLVIRGGEFPDGEVALAAISGEIFALHHEIHYDNPDIDKDIARIIEEAKSEYKG